MRAKTRELTLRYANGQSGPDKNGCPCRFESDPEGLMKCDNCNTEPYIFVEDDGREALVCECGELLRLLVRDRCLEDVPGPDPVKGG